LLAISNRRHAHPNHKLYRPLFSPYLAPGEFRRCYELAAPRTLVSPDRCYVLYSLLKQAIHISGNVWECGVYKGGTAAMMAAILRDKQPTKKLYLFDTFAGMPETDPTKDLHKQGDFADTSVEAVAQYLRCDARCYIRKGLIPHTFAGLEDERIAFIHIDLDIYRAILDCLKFAWPRVSLGGFVVLDDYGFPTCPGAREAVANPAPTQNPEAAQPCHDLPKGTTRLPRMVTKDLQDGYVQTIAGHTMGQRRFQ